VEEIRAFRGVPVSSLTEALIEHDHEVSVITTSSDVKKLAVFYGPKFTLLVLPQRHRARDLALTFYVKEIASIAKLLRTLDVDIVHAHWTYEYALGSLISGKKLVVTAHDAPWQVFKTAGSRKFWIFRLVLAYISRLFIKNLIFVSEDLQSSWKHEMFWRRQSKVIPNIPPFRVSDVPKIPSPEGVFRILTIGDDSRRKNVACSIEVAKELLIHNPQVQLHLVGVGLGKSEPLAMSHSENHYFRSLHWHGYLTRAQVQSLMLECDVLLQPSLLESFGLTLLEGMAVGLPVIAGKNTGGAQEVVGDAGVLVDTLNTSEIASTIKRLIDNPAYRGELSENGKNRILSKFSASKIVFSTIEYYKLVLEANV
jgi:glycosyltransferase involved in cell wall biosynthesis